MRSNIFLFIIFTTFLCTSANSQIVHRIFFTGGGGPCSPIEKDDFPVNYDLGYNADFRIGNAFHNNYAWCIDGMYNFYSNPTTRGEQLPEKPKFSITSVTANLLAGIFKKNTDFHPFTLIGIGVHFISSTDSSGVTLSGRETGFGLSIGAGASLLTVSSLGFFMQIKYDVIFSKHTVKGNIPFTAGIMYSPR